VIFQPTADISPITEHISIGGISSYGHPSRLVAFKLVLNVAWELTDWGGDDGGPLEDSTLPNGVVVRNGRLDDTDDIEDVRKQEAEIFRVVGLVNQARARGDNVLVTCAAGRNRSALVIAEHLIQVGGHPHATVKLIQAARSRALSNDAFVAWLKRRRS
jgi:protein-tyrosine phosphatase